MLAGACWAGGLLLLVLLIRERRDDPPVAAARRYSNMALSAIAIVVASGIIRAVAELGGLGALRDTLQTSYGRTLAIKVAVVAHGDRPRRLQQDARRPSARDGRSSAPPGRGRGAASPSPGSWC